MAFRINLSDGVDTINLFDGTDAQVREGGFGLPPPVSVTSFIGNPAFDGNRMARSRRGNRTLTISTKIVGSSLSDLKDNIRTINRLLNDAEKRTLLGYGSQVFLEYQWADTINESVFYDVLRGDLAMPAGFQSQPMQNGFTIIDARLTLTCKPYGRFTDINIAQETLENTSILQEAVSYKVSGNDTHELNAANDWEAQTFTVGASGITAIGASIQVFRGIADVPGNIDYEIYAVDGASQPTGGALASGQTSANAISDDNGVFNWLFCEFDLPVDLTAATEYALVIHGDDLAVAVNLFWKVDIAAGYADGNRVFSVDGGASWTDDLTDDFMFVILAQTTDANYQDIETDDTFGDVPAALFTKIAQTGATGTEKVWVAKRSGLRQKDKLWIDGIETSSQTDASPVNGTVTFSFPAPDVTLLVDAGVGNVATDTLIGRLNWTLNDLPRGQFRVLARINMSEVARQVIGFGWAYGDKTLTPVFPGDYKHASSDGVDEVIDFGVIDLPPIAESDIAISNSLELRLFCFNDDTLLNGTTYGWTVDWLFLLPIDEGVVILDAAAADVIGIDGITDPANVFIMDTEDRVEAFPDPTGRPFSLGREPTRIYVLRDDVRTVTFSQDLKYEARFMVI